MVEEELNYIQEYANIIEHRFRGRIHVVTKADEEARKKPVIKLLLQPLIENAVFHGLEQKIEGGSVKASVRMEGKGYLRFVIEDDGCGIGQEKLNALRIQIGSSMKEGEGIQKKCQGKESGIPEAGAEGSSRQRGIGMANICQRLRLFYGEKAFFQIESEEGRGTRITMMIPDRVEEEMV